MLASALAIVLSSPGASDAAGVYYVDGSSASCSDSGPGTEAQPYCTITAAVNARGGPGTTILVKPGTYREQVSIGASGASGSPLVLQALGSPVVVDGADDLSGAGNWLTFAGDVWLAAGVTWNPLQVFSDGARLTPSTAAPSSLPAGAFTWVSGQGLYVNVGGGNPGAHAILVGLRLSGFRLSGRSYVTIQGFTVLHTEDRAIYLLSACTHITLSDNVVRFANRMGIQAVAGSGNVIERNVVSDNNDHGIALTAGVTGSQVRDNESYRNAIPGVRAANGIYLYGAVANVLERNRVHDNQDTGLHLGGGSNDNVSLQNRSWNNGDHGFDHLSSTGTLDVGNVAFGNYKDGFSIEGSSTGTRVFDCIAVDNGLTTNEFDLWVDSGSTTGFVSDYNLFWNSTSQPPFKYIATLYTTIAAYQAASGQDAHSTQADPRFTNAAAGDLHLLAGSPAIDAADSGVPDWPATDAEGHARADDPSTPNRGAGPVPYADRGALEYTGPPDQAPVVTAPATATVPERQTLLVSITAADPDGQAIASLTASGLPSGATFTPGPGNASGTLAWTPAFDQAGPYTVTFTATNALSGSAGTAIVVTNVDRAPQVTAPGTAAAAEGSPLTLQVSAADPDGDPIDSLTAGLTPVPAPGSPGTERDPSPRPGPGGGTMWGARPGARPEASLATSPLPAGATFTPGPGNTSGTLAWTPAFDQAGTYAVTFTASDSLTASVTTLIQVGNVDRAPVVTAPAAAAGIDGQPLTVDVTVADPDGDAIASLTASGLPSGATFTPGPDNTTGTLTWTPAAGQDGSYTVTFTAANARSGSASTVITVGPPDRPPVVTAPATATVVAGQPLSVNVTASDPDGDAIASLTASGLPSGATFTPGSGNTSGTLAWTPVAGQEGGYTVTFTAANALTGSDSTAITVTHANQPPVAALVVTPATGNAPLAVTADASGSLDPDGAITSYRFDFGDGTLAGPQASPTAPHTYGAGAWTARVTVTDSAGATATQTAAVLVAAVGPQPNLVGNPSFEQNTNGWIPYSSNTLTRVAGGFDGAYSLRIAGPSGTGTFGVDDGPDWVTSTAAASATYRFTAWVRSATASGSARIKVREFSGSKSVGGPKQSPAVTLSPAWQLLTLDFVAKNAGSSLDFQILDTPVASGEVFLTDNIAIRDVTGVVAAAARMPGEGGSLPALVATDPPAERVATGLAPSLLRSQATLTFQLDRGGPLEIELLDLAGRRVRRVASAADAPPGIYRLTLDGRGDDGARLSQGIYFFRIRMPDRIETGRFVVMR